MGSRGMGLALSLASFCPMVGLLAGSAQASEPAGPLAAAERLDPAANALLRATSARTWLDNGQSVVLLEGNPSIDLNGARLSADAIVVWARPLPASLSPRQQLTIALVGNARLSRGAIVRSGEQLLVDTTVDHAIRLRVDHRAAGQVDSPVYRKAEQLRRGGVLARPQATVPGLPPGDAPVPPQRPQVRVSFTADSVRPVTTPQDTLALVLSGRTTVIARRDGEGLVELTAQTIVLFTNLPADLAQSDAQQVQSVGDAVEAVYLEGDVRIIQSPVGLSGPEQRLQAERAYYELASDRAVLTDVVLHSTDPSQPVPLFVRAQKIRQLARGEFEADNVQLSTSAFATPSYSLAASQAYVRQYYSGEQRLGNRTDFVTDNTVLTLGGLPVFYLPVVAGTLTDRGSVFRGARVTNSDDFGLGVTADLGLLETFGQIPPAEVDAWYRLGYFDARGPVASLNATYAGGFVNDTTRQPWNFLGDLRSYFVYDEGIDELGGIRPDIDPQEFFRGRVRWQHQHFLPNDWQVQLRAGWVSDATYLEEWHKQEFYSEQPVDQSIYLKRQRDSEAFTLAANYQSNSLVTSADFVQEQAEVEQLPAVGFHRIADSFADDSLTLFSRNTASGLRFADNDASLARQGLAPAGLLYPGLPSYGYTGMPDGAVYRGDFRQQVNFPITASTLRIMPYVVGRYTAYSDSPRDTQQHRALGGGGIRMTTAFWNVNDSASSEFWDIQRVRHVIEPEFNVFSSYSTTDRGELLVYQEQVDAVNDVTAVNLGLRQRWQTKRGGPGRWRSVDFFSLNVQANYFANQPDDEFLRPVEFRGLFFPSHPEFSVPRTGLNADFAWRVSETTTLAGDLQHNLEENELATAGLGVTLTRDRFVMSVGNRFINSLNANVTSVGLNYDITRKYTLSYFQSFEFGRDDKINYSAALTRRFDRLLVQVGFSYDEVQGTSDFSFVIVPEGFDLALSSQTFDQFDRR